MSVFTALPQDMLQWEIACFLTSADVVQFNEVLRRNERVYKKLSADYALKHHIKLLYNQYQGLAMKLNDSMDKIERVYFPSKDRMDKFIKTLESFFLFLQSPMSVAMYMHQRGLKEMVVRNLETWFDERQVYDHMSQEQIQKVRDDATNLIDIINGISFVRHVKFSSP
jgi:hypothetical protein